MTKKVVLITIIMVILAMTITGIITTVSDELDGFKEVIQKYDGKITYEIIKSMLPESERQYIAGYVITDVDGKVLLESDDFAYVADNGCLVEIKQDRDENGSLKYNGSIIMRDGKEDIFVPDVGLYPFGENFVGCLYLSKEIKGIYDYNGNIVFKPSDDERIIAIFDRLYVITKDFTKILDSEFNVIGQADFELSKRMLRNMYESIKGLDGLDYDKKDILGLIFEKDDLSGICDMDLNILVEAQPLGIIYHSNKLFELRDDTKLYLYNDGTSIKIVENYQPWTDVTLISPFSLKIGSPEVQTAEGIIYIDKDNLDVVPILENNRTLVPIRFIAERLPDMTIEWDAEQNKATFSRPGLRLSIVIGNSRAVLNIFDNNMRPINEINYTMPVSAQIINGRTFVPLRAVSELLGIIVSYDETTEIITIGR